MLPQHKRKPEQNPQAEPYCASQHAPYAVGRQHVEQPTPASEHCPNQFAYEQVRDDLPQVAQPDSDQYQRYHQCQPQPPAQASAQRLRHQAPAGLKELDARAPGVNLGQQPQRHLRQ